MKTGSTDLARFVFFQLLFHPLDANQVSNSSFFLKSLEPFSIPRNCMYYRMLFCHLGDIGFGKNLGCTLLSLFMFIKKFFSTLDQDHLLNYCFFYLIFVLFGRAFHPLDGLYLGDNASLSCVSRIYHCLRIFT